MVPTAYLHSDFECLSVYSTKGFPWLRSFLLKVRKIYTLTKFRRVYSRISPCTNSSTYGVSFKTVTRVPADVFCCFVRENCKYDTDKVDGKRLVRNFLTQQACTPLVVKDGKTETGKAKRKVIDARHWTENLKWWKHLRNLLWTDCDSCSVKENVRQV